MGETCGPSRPRAISAPRAFITSRTARNYATEQPLNRLLIFRQICIFKNNAFSSPIFFGRDTMWPMAAGGHGTSISHRSSWCDDSL